jgi:SAM-dependent methyltransferase
MTANIKTVVILLKQHGLTGFILQLKRRIFARPIKGFQEMEHFFLNKTGLEIGGPSRFFKEDMPVYDRIAHLDGVNFSPSTVWTGVIDVNKGYVVDGKRVGRQYILDAVDLSPVMKEHYDFVLSCNNIEHIANPIKAVEQWLSVLKKGGVLVVVAPRKEANFDHNREVVQFGHLIADYRNKTAEDDLTHLEEILTLHDLKMDPHAGTEAQFRERSMNNFENRCLHQHVFDLNVLNEIYEYFKLSVVESVRLDHDHVIIGQKQGSGPEQ